MNSRQRCKTKKKGRKVKIQTKNGNTKTIRLHKALPKGCSSARRICIRCLQKTIHKLDKNYDSRVCKECEE